MTSRTTCQQSCLAYYVIGILISLFAYCSSLLNYRLSVCLFVMAILLTVIVAVHSGRIVNFDLKATTPLLVWIGVAILALASYSIRDGRDFVSTFTLFMSVVLCIFSTENTKWISYILRVMLFIFVIFASVTVACYIFPSLYSSVIKPVFFPGAVYARDYRSGLAPNYSMNGTFCTMGFIVSSSLAFYEPIDIKKRHFFLALSLICFAALFLTTKRAHLLCGLFSVVFVYLISNNPHRFLKVVGIGVAAFLLIAILAPLIPGIGATVERFSATFSGNTSFEENVNNRTFLWDFAYSGFLKAPWLGHGWTSYCYRWPDGVTVTLMAHNELLNLLYESGIVGTAAVLTGCISSLYLTFRTIPLTDSVGLQAYLRLSLCIQIFFLTYAFTSGALFTTSSNVLTYFFAIAIMASIRWDVLKNEYRRGAVARGFNETD